MTREEVRSEIITALEVNYDADPRQVTEDLALSDLGLDSLDIAEFTMDLENVFGDLTEDRLGFEIDGETTIGRLVDAIARVCRSM